MSVCEFYWGGHGCDLAPGHSGPHRCGIGEEDMCSEYDAETGEARYALYGCEHIEDCACVPEWSEWKPNGRGWALAEGPPK